MRYWIKVIKSDEKSLIRKIYNQIHDNINEQTFSKTWVWQIKKLLHKLKLEKLWIEQYNIDRTTCTKLINVRLNEYFREEWINSAKHSHKGTNYLELSRFDPNLKAYLNFVGKDKSVGHMLKLRTGNHSLSVEIDRYKNRKTYEECICKSCDCQDIEDLFHVIVCCPGYSDIRQELIPFLVATDKAEFYSKMDQLNLKEIKHIINFMQIVEEKRKS